MIFFRTEGIIVTDTLKELSTILVWSKEDLTSFLPLNLIGVTLTNVLACITQEIKESLENFRHLDNVVLSEGKDSFTPLVGGKGNILSTTFNLD